ncbi:MAG: ABC transporter permease subunit [Proteobacteria bacterium]|nr:ABC transporter permease subunit [Pseudomonadota bacterium]
MLAAIPLSLGTAIFLSEFSPHDHSFGGFVRTCLDILAGVPSIVFGLFGNALFCKTLGLGFSIASGGLTLACMVLPLMIRITEEGLRQVPQDYRQAAASLGLTKSFTLVHLLIPAAIP